MGILMQGMGPKLEDLSVALFSHSFKQADDLVATHLLRNATSFASLLQQVLNGATTVMECCTMAPNALISQPLLMVLGIFSILAVFILLGVVGMAASRTKGKRMAAYGLPTFGLPTYQARAGRWS
jgi:hypothetical protein